MTLQHIRPPSDREGASLEPAPASPRPRVTQTHKLLKCLHYLTHKPAFGGVLWPSSAEAPGSAGPPAAESSGKDGDFPRCP